MATRRTFIRDFSALAASAAFVPASLVAAPRRWRDVALADIPFGTLAALVHSRFLLRDANGNLHPLELIEAEPASRGDDSAEIGGTEGFSLLFRGDVTRPLGQNTYAFEHSRLGRFEMFIVPVGREDGNYCCYEAVFNRPPPESRARAAGRRQSR